MSKDIIVLPEPFPGYQDLVKQLEKLRELTPPEPPALPGPWVLPQRKCMFDGLPPGVYGLVCQCPRCSPRCMSVT